MTHNPFNFKVGDKAYLDGVLECTIVFITPNGMFSKVTSPLYSAPYEVMTGRLLIGRTSPDTPLLANLKQHLDSITPEQLAQEFDEIQEWFQSEMGDEDDGLTPDELIIKDLHHEKQQHAIDFAKWLAADWMSIWVVDKWMWEWQHERTRETFNKYKEYYTEEELYELYIKEQHGND